jgi:poly-gamma-glutamate capsule biosynthesis protein CapA/YwtB (metallophosphatase superfamily)
MRSACAFLLLLLSACAVPPPAPPTLSGWHVLYAREEGPAGATLDLRAVGDVMLARHVGTLAERTGGAALFAPTSELLAADLTLGNLESPLSVRSEPARTGPYRLIAAPELAPTLHAAGFDALGLANNHALDAGPDGLEESLAHLRAAGIAPVGTGPGPQAALAPLIVQAQGLRVAIFAFNDVLDPGDPAVGLAPAADLAWSNPDFMACSAPAADCPHGRAWLSAAALAAVQTARTEADLVVVLVHWGLEYAAAPSARQRAWAADLVASGADLVLGAHPHVLQPAETLHAGERTGFVAYSLGNFVFDGPADPARSSGAVLRVLLDRNGVALVAAAPLATAGGRPLPLALASPEAQAALAALGAPGVVRPAATSSAPGREFPAATPLAVAPEAGRLAAWRWDGSAGQAVMPPPERDLGVVCAGLPCRPGCDQQAANCRQAHLPADLRGDGRPLWATLDAAGVVTLRDGPEPDAPIVWRNEDPAWRFSRVLVGDPNDDGRSELLLLLWQPDAAGELRSQPYLLGWRGGRFRIIWGGSATATPIQDLALANLDSDGRSELVVLEGGQLPGDPGTHVSVWRWHGWGFQLEWRSPTGRWQTIGLHTPAGEQAPWIVAVP